MPSETETLELVPTAGNFLTSFNRYGLPGAVIGAQFLIIVGLIYVVVTALEANTKAMTEFTGVLRDMKETIKELR